jgi:hypothetical protein
MHKTGIFPPRSLAFVSFSVLVVFFFSGCKPHRASFASPDEAVTSLQHCTADTCARLADAVHLAFTLRPDSCTVTPIHGIFEQGFDEALLNVQCSMDFELVLLARQPTGRWQYADSIPFPRGAFDVVDIGVTKLIDRTNDAIVIRNETAGEGTGLYQADFLVLQVLNSKLHTVLDTVEKGTFAVEADQPVVEQQSSFDITPATATGSGSVRETMTLKVGGKKVVVQRDFDWQKDLGSFEPGFWYSPDSVTESRKKSG